MKESIQTKIKLYLKEKDDWISGGLIEDMIRQTDGHKASNASRRCRELEDAGIIERRLTKFDGTPNMVVQYRFVRQRFLPRIFEMPSKSNPDKKHLITNLTSNYECDCDSYKYRRTCSHVEMLKRSFQQKQLSLI